MPSLARLSLALLFLALLLGTVLADPPTPAPAKLEEKKGTAEDVTEAKPIEPPEVLRRLAEDPYDTFRKLQALLEQGEYDADRMRTSWSEVCNADFSAWRLLTGRIKVIGPRSPYRMSVGAMKVPYSEWVNSHSRFLNEVLDETGVRVAECAGRLNSELKNLGEMTAAAKPILQELQYMLEDIASELETAEIWITEARTSVDVREASNILRRTRTPLKNIQQVLKIRRVLIEGFFKQHAEQDYEAEIEDLRAALSRPELEKGVKPEWREAVSRWILPLEYYAEAHVKALDDCTEAWEPLLYDTFYEGLPGFGGRESSRLLERHEEVQALLRVNEKRLKEMTKISTNLAAGLNHSEKLRERYAGMMVDEKPYEQIRRYLDEFEREPAAVEEFERWMEKIDPALEQELLNWLQEIAVTAGMQRFQQLMEQLEEDISNKKDLSYLQQEFETTLDDLNNSLRGQEAELKEFRYWKKVYLSEARELARILRK